MEAFDGGLHRCWHGSEMHRDMSGLRNQAPLSIKAGAGVVLALLDIGRVGRAPKRDTHLLRGRSKEMFEYFERDGVGTGSDRWYGISRVIEMSSASFARLRPYILDIDVPMCVNGTLPAWWKQNGAVGLYEQGRTCNMVAMTQECPVVKASGVFTDVKGHEAFAEQGKFC